MVDVAVLGDNEYSNVVRCRVSKLFRSQVEDKGTCNDRDREKVGGYASLNGIAYGTYMHVYHKPMIKSYNDNR